MGGGTSDSKKSSDFVVVAAEFTKKRQTGEGGRHAQEERNEKAKSSTEGKGKRKGTWGCRELNPFSNPPAWGLRTRAQPQFHARPGDLACIFPWPFASSFLLWANTIYVH